MALSSDPAPRRRFFALCGVAAVAALAGVLVGSSAGDGGAGRADRPSSGRRPASGGAPPRAARLPLEQQVGQLLLMSFDGSEAPGYIRRRLRRGEGAGVILFGKNAPNAGALRALTTSLQRSARGGALVATDQEGGAVRSVSFAPPEASQASLCTPAAARESASRTAAALRAAGINVNLAPVADVAMAGSALAARAYPGDAAAVGRLAQAAIRAHAQQRVAATLKHFPGLGRAAQNTDDAQVTIDAQRREIERSDLAPFRAGVRAGAALVMLSHALYPAYDRDRIASQSPLLIGQVLRRDLGFRGVAITDSIEAEAVMSRSSVAVAAERAVVAGDDIVLMTGSGSWNEIYPRLLHRARSSARFRARVVESAGRVIALKRRLGLRAPGGSAEPVPRQ